MKKGSIKQFSMALTLVAIFVSIFVGESLCNWLSQVFDISKPFLQAFIQPAMIVSLPLLAHIVLWRECLHIKLSRSLLIVFLIIALSLMLFLPPVIKRRAPLFIPSISTQFFQFIATATAGVCMLIVSIQLAKMSRNQAIGK